MSHGAVVQRPLRGTGGNEINDDNPSRADAGSGKVIGPNPCALVSKADAQAIVGKPLAAPEEAPLGPTCIYRTSDARTSVTLVVESTSFAKMKPLIGKPTRFTVDGHAAYCGEYGRQTTFVPLTSRRVLNIAAPCPVGARFAARALVGLRG